MEKSASAPERASPRSGWALLALFLLSGVGAVIAWQLFVMNDNLRQQNQMLKGVQDRMDSGARGADRQNEALREALHNTISSPTSEWSIGTALRKIANEVKQICELQQKGREKPPE